MNFVGCQRGTLLGIALLLVPFGLARATPDAASPNCPSDDSIQAEVGPVETDSALQALSAEYAKRLERLTRKGRAPGIAVAVIEHGQPTLILARGLRQRGDQQAFGADSVIPLGRMTEIPLQLRAMRLAREQRLDLDSPLRQPPASLRGAPALPSVRQLLSHQGGLNGGRLQGMYLSQAQLTERHTPEIYAARAPGLLESYSLVGLQLAFEQVQLAQGSDLREQILQDLAALRAPRCAQSRFSFTPATDDASGHLEKDPRPLMVARDTDILGLRGNLHGLIDLTAPFTADRINAGQVFSTEDFAALVRPEQHAALDFDRRGGIGFELATSTRPGVGRVALAFGAPPGFKTEIRIALDHQIATIVVGNGGDEDDLGELGGDLLDAVLSARKGIAPRDRDPPLPTSVAMPEGLEPAPWATRYATPAGRLKVERLTSDGFDFEIFGRAFRAKLRDDGWYSLSFRLLGLIPLRLSMLQKVMLRSAAWDGHSLLLAHVFGRTVMVGSAVVGEPAPEWISQWQGEYKLQNPDAISKILKLEELILGIEDQQLYVEYHVPMMLELRPRILLQALGPKELLVSGIGPLLGERLRLSQNDQQRVVEYAGYRFVRDSGS